MKRSSLLGGSEVIADPLLARFPYFHHALERSLTGGSLRNQGLIGRVVADPKPQIPIRSLNGKGAAIQRDSGRPDFLSLPLSNLLELL
jgi:hypothetical protein